MTTTQDKVRWMGTQESWADIVELYEGLETIAFWQGDGSLDVETGHGRQRVPIGSWICRRAAPSRCRLHNRSRAPSITQSARSRPFSSG
jgi:hypothetical protein